MATLEPPVGSPCAAMELVQSYDVSMEVSGEQDGEPLDELIDAEVVVSGDDYHSIFTSRSDGQQYESIVLDGVTYSRDSRYGPEWNIADYPAIHPTESFPGLGDNPLCPELNEFRALGEERVRGVRLWRYTDRTNDSDKFADVDNAFRGTKTVVENDVWVDDEGSLVQMIQDQYSFYQDDEQRIISITTSIMWFSGLGEPNIIKAPTVP